MTTAKPICMVPNCIRPPYTRGVCRQCYSVFSDAVNAKKKTTWKELESAGLVKLTGDGRKPKSPAGFALAALKDKGKTK